MSSRGLFALHVYYEIAAFIAHIVCKLPLTSSTSEYCRKAWHNISDIKAPFMTSSTWLTPGAWWHMFLAASLADVICWREPFELQVAEANRQWMEQEDGIIDDCTVIVIYLSLTPPSPVSSQRLSRKDLQKFQRQLSLQPNVERSVSKTFSQVAKRASALLTPKDIMQKCNIGTIKK